MATKGDRQYSLEQQARIILEAVNGDPDATCSRHGITRRTLQRWRKSLKVGDTELSRNVAEKKRALDDAWAEKIPGCLSACVEYITEAASQVLRTDPQAIHAVAGAMKLVSEVAATWKIIDARISSQSGQDAKAAGPVPAGSNVTPIRKSG
jgi:transposase-like protein